MLRAVIVDDEAIIIRGMKAMIERSECGIEVVGTAEDGLDALQIIREQHPDIVFADISMPIMSGLQLIEICRKEGNKVPFVILSGYKEFEYAKKAIALDVLEYMVKPLNPVDFKEFLISVCKTLREERFRNLQVQIESAFYSEHASVDGLPPWMDKIRFTFWNICIGMFSYFRKMGVEQENTEEGKLFLHQTVKQFLGEGAYLIETRYPNEYYLVCRDDVVQTKQQIQQVFAACCENAAKQGVTMVYGGCGLTLSQLRKAVAETEKLLRGGAIFADSRLMLSESDMPEEVHVGTEEVNLLCDMLSNKEVQKAVALMGQLLQRCHAGLCTQKNLVSFLKRVLQGCGWKEIQADADYYASLIVEQSSGYEELQKAFEKLFSEESQTSAFQLNDKSCHAILDAIAAYLASHAAERIAIQEVAEKFGFSYTYFSYLFKKVYGQSPSDYVIQCRIEHAKQLLKHPEETSVKEIALTVGYGDPYYFSRIFKTITGLTPSEFRKRSREASD